MYPSSLTPTQPPAGSELLTSLELVLEGYGPSREPPPRHQGLDQILSRLGQTPGELDLYGKPSSPNPGPEKFLARRDGTKQQWMNQGLKATTTFLSRHTLEQWSPVP